MADRTEAEAVAEIAQHAEDAQTLVSFPGGGADWILRRDDQVAEKIDYSEYLSSPARAQGTVVVYDAVSFANAVEQRRNREVGVTVYADVEAMNLEAVLDDDHGDGRPGWRQHRVKIALRPTVEWKQWQAAATAGVDVREKWLTQKVFATFVEERAPDFVGADAEPGGFPATPDAATMLEVAQRIEGARMTKMSGGIRLSTGDVVISWEESTVSKAGKAEVPTRFKIGIKLFYGLPPYEIKGALRHRFPEGGGVEFAFKFLNLERVLEDLFLELADVAINGPEGGTPHRPKLGWDDTDSVIWGPAPDER